MRLLAFAFTIVFVWTAPKFNKWPRLILVNVLNEVCLSSLVLWKCNKYHFMQTTFNKYTGFEQTNKQTFVKRTDQTKLSGPQI